MISCCNRERWAGTSQCYIIRGGWVHKCYITLYGGGGGQNMTFSRYIIYGWPLILLLHFKLLPVLNADLTHLIPFHFCYVFFSSYFVFLIRIRSIFQYRFIAVS